MDLLTTYTFRFLICSAVSNPHHWTEPQTDIQASNELLELRPMQLGVEVRGINLGESVSDDVIAGIKTAIHQHRLLLFRNQTEPSGDRHVEIAKWFGNIDLNFPGHRKSPSPEVYRMSNRWKDGHPVGTVEWHVDECEFEKLCSFTLFHMVMASRVGKHGKVFVVSR